MTFLNEDDEIESITIDTGNQADKCICVLENEQIFEPEIEANAQAIKAVPDMIDDLIKDYKLWLDIKNNTTDPKLIDAAEDRLLEIQPTLKKAGVTEL